MKKNLKDLIEKKVEQISIKGSYRDVKTALSLYDKKKEYEIKGEVATNEFLVERVEK